MDRMPVEILSEIFQYVSYSDKCALRLVCTLFETVLNYELFNTASELIIDDNIMAKFPESAINTILDSKRTYYTWKIKNIYSFPRLYELFERLGHNVMHLTIEQCVILEVDIYQMLQCLPNIITLSFVTNAAFDSIPASLTIPSLRRLSFSNINVLTDHIFPSLLRLFPFVEALSFHNCYISFSLDTFLHNYGPDALQNQNVLSNLSSKIFTSRAIYASLLVYAPQVVSIDFSMTNINDSGLLSLCEMRTLQLSSLNLSQCMELRRNALFQISVFRATLTTLNLSHVPGVTDMVMLDICFCLRQLKYFNCSHLQRLTSKGIAMIHLLKQLIDFNISHCPNVTIHAVVRNLGNTAHPTLKQLNLAYIGYECNVLPELANRMPNLTELTVTCLGWHDICYIYRRHRKLVKLDAACKFTQDTMVTGIDKIRPGRLRRLHFLVRSIQDEIQEKIEHGNETIDWPTHRDAILSLCYQLADRKFQPDTCLSNLKGLQYLNLSGEHLSNEIFYTGFRFPCLKVIHLTGTKISTKGIIILVAKNPGIETLNLNMTNISDNAVEIMALGLNRLHSLSVKFCQRLTDKSLKSIVRHAHFLRELDITGCRQISQAMVDEVVALPFMKTVRGGPFL